MKPWLTSSGYWLAHRVAQNHPGKPHMAPEESLDEKARVVQLKLYI